MKIVESLTPFHRIISNAIYYCGEIIYILIIKIIEIVNDDFWIELQAHLDKTYHGMIQQLAGYPGISKKDLKFISLCCCGFSNSEIALILNYSLKYVSNKRKHITQKLGIDIPLQDYLNSLMTEHGLTIPTENNNF